MSGFIYGRNPNADTLDGLDSAAFAILAGQAGGQTLQGGTAANEDLTLEGTSNATKTTSYVILQPTAGNVGINTTAPTAILGIKAPIDTPYVKALEFDASMLDDDARKWNLYLSRWTNVGSTRLDSILSLGYNQSAGGSALDPTDHALYMQFENFYQPAATSVAEWHINFTAANDAVTKRPLHINVNTDGSYVETFQTANKHNFVDEAGEQIIVLQNGVVDFANGTCIRFLQNNVVAFKQSNAAGNGILDVFWVNSLNQFHIGVGLSGLYLAGGNLGVGNYVTAAKAHIDQNSATGAIPVLLLDQADVSEPFIKLIGESTTDASQSLIDAANLATPGAIVGWAKIYVEDVQATGPITDGVYWVPFYAAPTA